MLVQEVETINIFHNKRSKEKRESRKIISVLKAGQRNSERRQTEEIRHFCQEKEKYTDAKMRKFTPLRKG